MLRELVDPGWLEDLLDGVAQMSGQRLAAYDEHRRLICATGPSTKYARLVDCVPPELPPRIDYIRLPADEPPAQVGLTTCGGAGYVVAGVYVDQLVAGFIAVGEVRLREQTRPPNPPRDPRTAEAVQQAFDALPVLDPSANARPIRSARWASRVLSEWCRREMRVVSISEQFALMGDIAALLTGDSDLKTVLAQIAAETSRVMKCRFCSIRLYNRQTQTLEMAVGHNLSDRYLNKGTVRRQANEIDDEALSGGMVYVEDATTDPRYQFSEEARKEGIVSVLTTGMHYRGTPVGVMRVYTDRLQRFRSAQRKLLQTVAAQAATAIANAQLLEQRLRAVETERELALAGQVQQRMLHFDLPNHPFVTFGHASSPTSHVSGDFADFLTLCDQRQAVVVADVVGKGVPAALLGASLRGALRAGVEACTDLGELFARLNRHVCNETTPAEFVTLLMLVVSGEGRRIDFCSAGHEPPLLLRDGQITTIEEGNLVLGFRPEERFAAGQIEMQPGDFLLMYTDGVTDAHNFAGDRFDRQRLHESIALFGQMPPDQACRNILWDVRRFVGLAEQFDDMTLVGLSVS